jgi:hypothetical protein
MWKRVMGTGLFEPLDNFSAASEPSNPSLMSYLEELLIDLIMILRHIRRFFIRVTLFSSALTPFNTLTGPLTILMAAN